MKSSEYHAVHIVTVLRYIDYYSKIISISGHRRHYRVMEFAWTRTEQFSSMDIRTDIVPVCFVENALLPWKRMIPGRFSALPFDLRQQANVFVHPCILNLSTFSSVFLFFFSSHPLAFCLTDWLRVMEKSVRKFWYLIRDRAVFEPSVQHVERDCPFADRPWFIVWFIAIFVYFAPRVVHFPPFLLSSLSSVILNIEFVWNCSNNHTRVTCI